MADTLSAQEMVEEIDSLESIPEEFVPGLGPLYPGVGYVFRLPGTLKDLFGEYEINYGKPNEDKKLTKFLRLTLRGDSSLTIVAAPPEGADRIGTPFGWQVSNQPRARGKEKVMISNMTYLYKALGGKVVAKNFQEWKQELSKFAGRAFKANVEYSSYCNKQKQAYIQDPESGRSVPRLDEAGNAKNGCGENFYFNKWPKDGNGKYALQIQCACGAVIRPFNDLSGFGAAPNA